MVCLYVCVKKKKGERDKSIAGHMRGNRNTLEAMRKVEVRAYTFGRHVINEGEMPRRGARLCRTRARPGCSMAEARTRPHLSPAGPLARGSAFPAVERATAID